MKREYKCKLFYFRDMGKNTFVAVIRRLEPHVKLGMPVRGTTVTSRILNINFVKKEFETENSFYNYGGT